MSRASGRRGLAVVLLMLLVLLGVADLMRRDSLLRGAWNAVTQPEGTPMERALHRFGVR